MATPDPALTRSAAVVGAGIGGLAAALALGRAGWSVTVHERAPELTALGAGLVLAPNAVRALDALGVGAAVRERAAHLTASALLRPEGRTLSRLDATRLARRHGAPVLAVERAALHALLADAVGPGVVRCGSEVADASALAASHDLVVAADGLRSRIRTSAWPDAAAPAYAGYSAWRAVVRTGARVTEASETWGVRERFGVVPVSDGVVYVFATATVPAGGREDGTAELAELRRRFGGWHAPVPALLEAVDPATVLRHDVEALPTVPATLHRGTTVLVGDAAHAMEPNLGQGAGLALEDAVVLAHVLAGEPRVEHALARFTALRRPRAAALLAASARLGRLTQRTGPVAARVRDAAVRLTPAAVALRGSDAVMGWRPPRTDAPATRPVRA